MSVTSPDPAPTVTRHSARGNAVWWSALTALCLILLAPLTLVDVPPLLDYPNHLARLFVLAFGATDPVIARFYQPHWEIIPNLALDLTVPALLRVWPVHLAGRCVIGIITILPVLGAAAYYRALTGRFSYWPLASVLFAYNEALLKGFLNFIASVGLALLFAAVWVAWRNRRPSLAVPIAAAGAVVLFFCHLIGLVFFAILIGAHDLAWLLTKTRTRDRETGINARFRPFLNRLAAGGVVFAVPVVLYALSDLSQLDAAPVFRPLADKARAAMPPVINYLWPLDLATAVLVVAIPAICVIRRWCRVPLQAALALALLVALYVGLPFTFKETFDLDTRFIIMAAAFAPAALVPIAPPRRATWALGAGFLILFTVRIAVVMNVWTAWASDLAAFRAVIASIRPGDVVLTVALPEKDEGSYWTPTARRLSDGSVMDAHLPALLLIEHRAWWPFIFDNQSQQPIETREPYRTLNERVYGASDPIALVLHGPPELHRFTHVLVTGAAAGQAATTGLRWIAGNSTTALFAINGEESPPPPSAR